MSNQKKFGVWMDNHHASIAGSSETAPDTFTLIAHVKAEATSHNSSEKNDHHQEQGDQRKFFKEIASHLTNATDVHVTGTGDAQEQFMHFLADTPEFKHTKTAESTSNKMSDEKLMEYLGKH